MNSLTTINDEARKNDLESNALSSTSEPRGVLGSIYHALRSNAFAIVLAAVYFPINLYLVMNHAMFRDEWDGFFRNFRSSPTIKDLYNNTLHTGHGFAWSLFTWLISQMGTYPWGVKLSHAIVSTAMVFLFAKFSPFTRQQKAMFAFGFFPIYLYGTILRDYHWMELTLLIACILFCAQRRRPIVFGIALAAMFQFSTSFAVVVGLALGAAYLFDLWWRGGLKNDGTSLWQYGAGGAIAFLSLFAAYQFQKPSPDVMAHRPGQGPCFENFCKNLSFLGKEIWRVYCPIISLNFSPGIFDTNIFDAFPWVQMTLGLILVFAVILFLLPRPTALFFFVCGTAVLVLFNRWCMVFWATRHEGHLFFVMIASLWIFTYSQESATLMRIANSGRLAKWRDQQSAFLTVILGIHLIAGVSCAARELVVPFSGSRQAAEIIKQKAPSNVSVISDMPYAAQGIAGYLDRPVYIASRGDYCTFCKLDAKFRLFPVTSLDELRKSVNQVMASEKRDVVIAVNFNINITGDQVQVLGVTSQSLCQDETFVVYLIKYFPPIQ
jgi:hypothetical protein